MIAFSRQLDEAMFPTHGDPVFNNAGMPRRVAWRQDWSPHGATVPALPPMPAIAAGPGRVHAEQAAIGV